MPVYCWGIQNLYENFYLYLVCFIFDEKAYTWFPKTILIISESFLTTVTKSWKASAEVKSEIKEIYLYVYLIIDRNKIKWQTNRSIKHLKRVLTPIIDISMT